MDEVPIEAAGKAPAPGPSSPLALAQEAVWQNRRFRYLSTPLVVMALSAILSRDVDPRALFIWSVAVGLLWLLDILISEWVCGPALARGEGERALLAFALSQFVLRSAIGSFSIWSTVGSSESHRSISALLIIVAMIGVMAPVRSLLLFAGYAGPYVVLLLLGPFLVDSRWAMDVAIVNLSFLAIACGLALRTRDLATANARLLQEQTALGIALGLTKSTLLDAENRLALANADRRRFLKDLSGEMSGPAQALVSATQALREELNETVNERARFQANDVAVNAALLANFANDLSDLESLESGTLTVNSTRLDLPALLSSLHEAMLPRLQDRQISMDVLAFADLPLLLADEHIVRRMALNLLANVMSATEPGGRVTLAAFRLPDGGIGLRASSTGLGLSESAFEHVLEDFLAGRHDRINGETPTGLALTIVRALAALHGASLSTGRRIGIGAYATVHFPPERLLPRRALVRFPEAA